MFEIDEENRLEREIYDAKQFDIAERIQTEQDSIRTCQEWIMYYLDKFQDAGVQHFTAKETMNIIKIMKGYKGDIVVFSNGGSPFDVWIFEDKPGAIKELIESEHLKGFIFCYRIDGVDTISRHTWIPNHYYKPEFYERTED